MSEYFLKQESETFCMSRASNQIYGVMGEHFFSATKPFLRSHKIKVKIFFVLHQISYLKMKRCCTLAVTRFIRALLLHRLFEIVTLKNSVANETVVRILLINYHSTGRRLATPGLKFN